jgi:nucleoid-associated protein YgaU
MSLVEKYQSLIDLASSLGVSGLNVTEADTALHIDGAAPSAAAKQALWDHYGQLDPEFRSGDLVLNVTSAEAASVTYTVVSGDNLSKIGKNYGVSWKEIFDANRDQLSDPDKIQVGQELVIPQ